MNKEMLFNDLEIGDEFVYGSRGTIWTKIGSNKVVPKARHLWEPEFYKQDANDIVYLTKPNKETNFID